MESGLKTKAVSGVIWSGIERFSTLAIQMLCTLIIARFLSPADFGTVGLLTIFTAIAQCLVDSGFRTALIRKENPTETDYSSVFYFYVLVSIILYIVLFFLSPTIADFYKLPELNSVAKITFLIIPISSFGLVQGTILTKKLDFKRLSYTSIISALVSGVLGVYLAITYKTLWAIVYQNLFFYMLQSILLGIFSKWKPSSFSLSSIKDMFGFSFNMMLSSLVGTIFNNLYSLIIGKIYSPADLGNYTQASRIEKIPSTSITEVVQRVSLPVLSKFQNDNFQLKRSYEKIIGITFLVVSYIMFILMGCSESLFDVLFNDEWVMAGKFFAILCINGVIYPLHSINLNIITVKGKSSLVLMLEIVRRVIMVLIILISAHFSINVFVWGQVFYSVTVLFINLTVCGRCINYSVARQIGDLLPTFLIGLITMLILKLIIPILLHKSILILLMQLICGFAITYALSSIFHVRSFEEIKSIVGIYLSKHFRHKLIAD